MAGLQFHLVQIQRPCVAAGYWVLADGAVACRGFLFGLGLPAAHEVVVSVGVVVSLVFPFGQDLRGLPCRGERGFDVQAGWVRAAQGSGITLGLAAIGLVLGIRQVVWWMQWREVRVRVPAVQFGVGRE